MITIKDFLKKIDQMQLEEWQFYVKQIIGRLSQLSVGQIQEYLILHQMNEENYFEGLRKVINSCIEIETAPNPAISMIMEIMESRGLVINRITLETELKKYNKINEEE